jgi:hypothetical protein
MLENSVKKTEETNILTALDKEYVLLSFQSERKQKETVQMNMNDPVTLTWCGTCDWKYQRLPVDFCFSSS